MHKAPARQAGLTLLETMVATGLVAAGAVFAWQYYQAEIARLVQLANLALERFVTS